MLLRSIPITCYFLDAFQERKLKDEERLVSPLEATPVLQRDSFVS